ncbi:MAG: TatD family hydrolase [bacterium]
MTNPKRSLWIDTHMHVTDIGANGKWRKHMLEGVLNMLEESGADLRIILSCDKPYTHGMKHAPEQILAGNRMVYDLIRQAPDKLYGSCMINPNFLEESLKVMKICFEEWGFVQLGEMLQYTMDYRMNSNAGEKVVKLAARYNAPVQIHLGSYWFQGIGESGAGMEQMEDLLGIAERVPEAKYILGHAIGCGPTSEYIPWGNWFLDVLNGVFLSYPDNFWVEIMNFSHSELLKRVLKEVPTNRLLVGTDWSTRIGPPFQPYGEVFRFKEDRNKIDTHADISSIKKMLLRAGSSRDMISQITYKNAMELYNIRI